MRLSIATNAATADVLLTIHPPEPLEEASVQLDLCCVLDVSGSMGSPTNVKDAYGCPISGGGPECNRFPSALSLARYVLRAVVSGLSPTDRFALVTFSDDSKTMFPLSYMDAEGRTRALAQIDACEKPHGGSNLWSGLGTGIRLLTDTRRVRTVFLLSDGNANYKGDAERVLSPSITRNVVIHVLGVSDRPNGLLLSSVAQNGGGQLAFVPNISCAIPIVSNFLVNARATFAHQGALSVRVHWEGHRAGRLEVLGGHTHVPEHDWSGVRVELGHLLYHIPQHILLRVRNSSPLLAHGPDKPFVSASVSCVRLDGLALTANAVATKSLMISGSPEEEAALVRLQAVRCELVDAVLDMRPAERNPSYILPVARCVDRLRAVEARILENHDSDLLSDFQESLFQADQKKLFADFARNSVLMNSVALSHLRERHVDDSIRGTRIYLAQLPAPNLRSISHPENDAHLFNWIADAPRPTLVQELATVVASWIPQPLRARTEVPCFDGTCFISLADGSDMMIRDLHPGVRIATSQGPRSVHAIVRTQVRDNKVGFCVIGSLRITPWHPILRDGCWTFPSSVVPERQVSCAAVYSVLLERPMVLPCVTDVSALRVGGIWCAPLGHGVVSGNSVLRHPYLGNWDAVARDLDNLPVENGVRLAIKCIRNELGTVSGFV